MNQLFRLILLTLAFAGTLCLSSASAETQDANREPASKAVETAAQMSAPPPAPSSTPALELHGYLDLYYSYNTNRPARLSVPTAGGSTLPPSQNRFRNFDLYHDQFSLNLAELSLQRKSRELFFRLDLDFGEEMDAIHVRADGVTSDEISKHVGQAFVSYTPEDHPDLTITVGKMFTHMGFELLKLKQNWQYSLSYVGEMLPYWHVGASVNYVMVPKVLTVGGYVYNGWNNLQSVSAGKALGLQVALLPHPDWSITYNGITGADGSNAADQQRQVHELIAMWKPTENLNFALDTILGRTSGDARWSGGSLAARWALTPRYALNPRLEYFHDRSGFNTGSPQMLRAFTLTQIFNLAEGLETRLEFRRDQSDQSVFWTESGTSDHQQTFSLSFLYSF